LKPYKGLFRLQVNGDMHTIHTDSHGGFETKLTGDFNRPLTFLEKDGTTPISQLHTYQHIFDYRDATYMVVSDIDDTILVSKSSLFFSKLWLMLFRQTARRSFVEETECAYRRLMKTNVPFVYVSASEYNLYSIISNFIVYHDLPVGPILLRPFQRWKNVVKSKSRLEYKINRIERLIAQFPDTRFILFGDDSQHDPLVFERIASKYPKNVRSVFLRKTGWGEPFEIQLPPADNTDIDVHLYEHFSEIEKPVNNLINEITAGR
ncbi:MAG: App1 family protein, partial [Cryomorphaceae bacterium]